MATLKPPFTPQTAREKVKAAQNLWNTRTPSRISAAYTPSTVWRNRHLFLQGTAEVESFLRAKWERELDYRLRKELFAFENRRIGGADKLGGYEGQERWEGRIAVQFWYEYRDSADGGRWKRCYGLEDWTFDEKDEGKMWKRQMSASDIVLGKDGDGVAVTGEGIQGRWFVDGADVDEVALDHRHY